MTVTVRGCTPWPARWKHAPRPRNVQELWSFLGLLHYYGKFLTGLDMLLHALNHLLKTGQKWTWTKECTEAFEAPKKLPSHSTGTGSLWSLRAHKDAWRHLSLWHWGSDFPCVPWWKWMGHHVSITNLDHYWEELSSNWKRGLVTGVQNPKVPPVFLRT